jgi:hypothetical protein
MGCVLHKLTGSSQGVEPFDELAIPPRLASRKTGNPAVLVDDWAIAP